MLWAWSSRRFWGRSLGGYLTDTISWRWAFYINIPIGILALLLQSKFLEDPPMDLGSEARPARSSWARLPCHLVGMSAVHLRQGTGGRLVWKQQYSLGGGNRDHRSHRFPGSGIHCRAPAGKSARVLANRNLLVGSILIFLLGGGIYGITTILPLFYQTLMGYERRSRGPGGCAARTWVDCGRDYSGRAVGKDGRSKAGGVGVSRSSRSRISGPANFTLDISPSSLFWPIVVSGLAISLVFVPLSNLSLGTLEQDQVGNGSGMWNFLRNIGGSIGISVANTIAQRHLQSHRNDLVHSFNHANPILRRQLQALTTLMGHHAGPVKSSLRAIAITQRSLNNQAQIYAYVDVFHYMAIVFAICVPMAFLMKSIKGKTSQGAA